MLGRLWFVSAAAAVALSAVGCSAEDPFDSYRAQVNQGGGDENGKPVPDNEAARQEFEQAKTWFCSMSKADLEAWKGTAEIGLPYDPSPEDVQRIQKRSDRTANKLGAIWEFGCEKGHDPAVYKPHVIKDTTVAPEPEFSVPDEEPAQAAPELPDVADDPLWPSWPGKVYTYGDCDSALVDWQLQMNTYGYDFQGTGCYYQETKEAVLDLQEANGLDGSGRIGPATWDAAWSGVPPTR